MLCVVKLYYKWHWESVESVRFWRGFEISCATAITRQTRMHSSRMRVAHGRSHGGGGVCLSACWDTPLGMNLETAPSVGLETPPPAGPRKLPPPGYGPGDLQCMLGYPPGDLQGMLGYHLQGMLGYHSPCEQNDRQVQKYYLSSNFVCGR